MMNVIGIGDNVVDKYVHTQTMYPGGNALNFAAYAAMLGHNAAYLGIFGNDAAAEHVKQRGVSPGHRQRGRADGEQPVASAAEESPVPLAP